MPIELSMPLVIGLLTDLETQTVESETALLQAEARAQAIEHELGATVVKHHGAQDVLRGLSEAATTAARDISQGNNDIGRLHGEIAPLQRRANNMREMMAQAADDEAKRHLRRGRAAVMVQVEERQKAVQKKQAEVAAARTKLHEAQQQTVLQGDVARGVSQSLDALQAQLPDPHLYLKVFELRAARAHCRLYLDRDGHAWRRDLLHAVEGIIALHRALRAGRYRLDQNSEVVGGRADATAEAIYACAALNEQDLGVELFQTATESGLFFHQIFNVFRVWTVGMYMAGDARQLAEMLRTHQDAYGQRGAYVQAFIGLLTGEAGEVRQAMANLAAIEWELWSRQGSKMGLGVVNVPVLGINQLAREQGMGGKDLGPTVPLDVF